MTGKLLSTVMKRAPSDYGREEREGERGRMKERMEEK